MPRLQFIESNPIYRNPNPGYRCITAAGSHPVQISENEMVCTYNRGSAYYATDLTFHLARSFDGGTTWPEQSLLRDHSGDDRPYSYHDPMLTRLSDGSLVIITFRMDRSDPDRALFNEQTGGLGELENVLLRSFDNGRTWSEPISVPELKGYVITPSCGVVELADGRWMLHFDRWHRFDDRGPYRPLSVLMFSSDGGRTWSEPSFFGDGEAEGKGFWHGRTIIREDGRLYSLFWAAENQKFATLPNHRSFGSPDGAQWSAPEETNLPGQTNYPVDYGNGLMAAIYTLRESENPGLFVALSQDDGKIWDLENQVCAWDATGRDKLGVSAPESYPRSHDTIAFGAPTANKLSNGDLYVTFWCTEMSITHVRYARLRIV